MAIQLSPYAFARDHLGPWPGKDSKRARYGSMAASGMRAGGSLSGMHAVRVWNECVGATCARAARLERDAGGGMLGRERLAGLVELEMVSCLADHLISCERCWTTGSQGHAIDRPVEWIEWACATRKGLRDVLGAVLLDRAGVTGLRSLPPGVVRSVG